VDSMGSRGSTLQYSLGVCRYRRINAGGQLGGKKLRLKTGVIKKRLKKRKGGGKNIGNMRGLLKDFREKGKRYRVYGETHGITRKTWAQCP